LKLTAKDIKGVVLMNPTPSTPNAGDWRETMSIDFDTSKKLFNMTLDSGVSGYALCGTLGENPGLIWDEKKAYIKTAIETINHRAYIFAGATALGTKEVIRQMRELHALGADGCFVGLPLWQTPTIQNMNDWWRDLAEACPDIPIMVYANSSFFKTTYPNEFWQGIGKHAPTAVAAKVSYAYKDLDADMDAATSRVQFLPGNTSLIELSRKYPGRFKSAWIPQPPIEASVAMVNAVVTNDADSLARVEADFKALPSRNPPMSQQKGTAGGPESEFAMYNAQVVREAWNAQSYLHVGPPRPPYRDLPQTWVDSIGVWGKAVDVMRKKYIGVKAVK
ncbi:MAG: hypothetical protein EXR59_05675, partial [Dehalococcoidia bacterium]|nr:hypothetical protein [Dehalococcoidia bacterium]